jgi:peptidoglycan/LPS O-acetylase OafA/YrhL
VLPFPLAPESIAMESPRPQLSHPKYRPDIDGLRAVAVSSVVIFHAFPAYLQGGFVGVDVFFVISGFLISTIIFENLAKGSFSFSEFYARRIKRIFPALCVVLVACYIAGWYLLLANEYQQLGKHITAGAGFISNFVLWNEAGYFDKSADTKPLLHLWSLGIEEQFYIVWPVLLWAAWKLKLNLMIVTIFFATLSFSYNMVEIGRDSVATFYHPLTRFWELLCGAVLARFVLDSRNSEGGISSRIIALFAKGSQHKGSSLGGGVLENVLSFVGLILLGCTFWGIDKTMSFPGIWATVPVLGAALIILAGPETIINRWILSNRLAVWLGLISFPLYLWHWPLLSFPRIIEGQAQSPGICAAMVGLSVLLAWLTYRLVERPIRFGRRTGFAVALLVCLMTTIGYVGFHTYSKQGLPLRFPEQVRVLSNPIDLSWESYIQWDRCHLQDPNKAEHDQSCYQTTRPLVVLWGDSHAASLYPGLKHIQERRGFGLTQLTQAGCGPIFGLEKLIHNPHCNEVNDRVFSSLQTLQPDTLIIHAAWRHDHYPLSNDSLFIKLRDTLTQIKAKLGKTRVILVGPIPRWPDSPQRSAFNYWRKSVVKTAAVPTYIDATILYDVEVIVSQAAVEGGVEYVSPRDHLCSGAQCLWKVGDDKHDFIARDYGHLSKAGSIFLAERIFPGVLPN